ncbi:MAG: ATP-binding protein [Pseudomonadota bacterium]
MISLVQGAAFNSLLARFIGASLLLLPVFIFVIGGLLVHAFAHSQNNAEREKLQAQLYTILSVTEIENQRVVLPEALTEPRFNNQNSGLYSIIYGIQGEELWRSASASLLSQSLFDPSNPFFVGTHSFSQANIDNITLNRLSHDIEWISEDGTSIPLRVIVSSDNSPLAAEINSYRNRLWQWLSAMGVLLVAVQMAIMLWGLQPLKRLSIQLRDLQQSKIQGLDKNYPKEIQPVTESFNAILIQEKQQRERYRNTMSDLAHSLKTPLALIQSQINQQQMPIISEQLDRINQIISHQLNRAVIRVNRHASLAHTDKISVKATATRLIKILDKVYTEKNISFVNEIAKEHYFFGDEADLLEVLGNILDNACKYGRGHVAIHSTLNASYLVISICDNGPGIPEKQRSIVLARGARGDTAQAGQGIGLSVAVDIISSYGGGLEVNNNGEGHLSGACFSISFPVVQSP